MDNEILRVLQDILNQDSGYQDEMTHTHIFKLIQYSASINDHLSNMDKTSASTAKDIEATLKNQEKFNAEWRRDSIENRNYRNDEKRYRDNRERSASESLKLQKDSMKNAENYHKELKSSIEKTGNGWTKVLKDVGRELWNTAKNGTTEMMGAALGNVDKTMSALHGLSAFGVTVSDGANQFYNTTHAGVMSIELFTKTLQDNSTYIARLNAQGENGVASFNSVLSDVVPKMKKLGFSQDEQASAIKSYLENQKILGQFERMSNIERQASMNEYMLQLSKMSQVMGVSREEMEKRLSFEKAQNWEQMMMTGPNAGLIKALKGAGVDSKEMAAMMGNIAVAGSDTIAKMIQQGRGDLIGSMRGKTSDQALALLKQHGARESGRTYSDTEITMASVGIGRNLALENQWAGMNLSATGELTGQQAQATHVENLKESAEIIKQSLGLSAEGFKQAVDKEEQIWLSAQKWLKNGVENANKAWNEAADKITTVLTAARLDDLTKALFAFSGSTDALKMVALSTTTKLATTLGDFLLDTGAHFLGNVLAKHTGAIGKTIKGAFSAGGSAIKNAVSSGMKLFTGSGGLGGFIMNVAKFAGPVITAVKGISSGIDAFSAYSRGDYRGGTNAAIHTGMEAGKLALGVATGGLSYLAEGFSWGIGKLAGWISGNEEVGRKWDLWHRAEDWIADTGTELIHGKAETKENSKKIDEATNTTLANQQAVTETSNNIWSALDEIKSLLSGPLEVTVTDPVQVANISMNTL